MTVHQRFADALRLDARAGVPPELLPDRLARAAARATGADGAGVSVHGDGQRRTPLGASDPVAATAERLQFTTGSGPCLLSARSGWPVFCHEAQLRAYWPELQELLVARTPYRSVLALPLGRELGGLGALDLYLEHPEGVGVDAFDAREVADLVSEQLGSTAAWSSWTEDTGPPWLDTAAARERARVWQAMGMIGVELGLDAEDALAVLRAHAYAADRVADAVAADITEGRLPVAHLDRTSPEDGAEVDPP